MPPMSLQQALLKIYTQVVNPFDLSHMVKAYVTPKFCIFFIVLHESLQTNPLTRWIGKETGFHLSCLQFKSCYVIILNFRVQY